MVRTCMHASQQHCNRLLNLRLGCLLLRPQGILFSHLLQYASLLALVHALDGKIRNGLLPPTLVDRGVLALANLRARDVGFMSAGPTFIDHDYIDPSGNEPSRKCDTTA